MGKSKRNSHCDATALGPAIKSAIYAFFQDCGLKKTSKYLKKETSAQDFVDIDFKLAPLFNRIEEEYNAEKKKRKRSPHTKNEASPKKARKIVVTDASTKSPKEADTVASPAPDAKSGPLKRLDDKFWKSQATIRDNSYWAKGGDDFARKAAQDLIRVRGKDFRSEKAKKKKASWKGTGRKGPWKSGKVISHF